MYIVNEQDCWYLEGGILPKHLDRGMFDGPLILWVNLPKVDTIHPKGNNFVTGVKTKATDDKQLNNSPEYHHATYMNVSKSASKIQSSLSFVIYSQGTTIPV